MSEYCRSVSPNIIFKPGTMPGGRRQSIDGFFRRGDDNHAKSSLYKFQSSESRKRRKIVKGSNFGECPICRHHFPLHKLQIHASECDGRSATPVLSQVNQSRNAEESKNMPSPSPKRNENPATSPPEPDTTSWWRDKFESSSPSSWMKPTSEPIPGLLVFENFFTDSELERLLHAMDHPKHPSFGWKQESHSGLHRQQRWGIHHDLWSRQVQTNVIHQAIPDLVRELVVDRLASRIRVFQGLEINDVNAIDYRKSRGDSLRDHMDDRQKHLEPIANISVHGCCDMTFIRTQGRRRGAQEKDAHKVRLRPGTLQVLTGSARYDYTHGIRNHDLCTERRVSLTLRQTR